MKNILFIIMLLISGSVFAQTTDEVIADLQGQFDRYSEIAANATIAEIVFASSAVVPVIMYPIATWGSMSSDVRQKVEYAYEGLSVTTAVAWLISFSIKTAYQRKAIKIHKQIYDYKKIISDENQMFHLEEKSYEK